MFKLSLQSTKKVAKIIILFHYCLLSSAYSFCRMELPSKIMRIFIYLAFICLGTIYICMILSIWARLLTDFYVWLRYTQTIISINWAPCSDPGQFCPPWRNHELMTMNEHDSLKILEDDLWPNLDTSRKYYSLDGILMAKPPNDNE